MTRPAPVPSLLRTGAFRRVAVLNRGEAAMRFIRGAQTWSRREHIPLESIALYTAADAEAPFVQAADFAVPLPDPGPGGTSPYVDIELLLDNAQAAGADAVWPGWGFVSEAPELAQACEARGLIFLGPPAQATRQMADKVTAKLLAEQCRVPVAPWSREPVADVAQALERLEHIGYPALLKSAAGGGGRGIRLVHQPADVKEAFQSAAAEALSTSGNPALFIERFITEARHVEVQVVADAYGNVWTLGTRDCSVQRRNQKLIEEAPAPELSDALRADLEACARRLARACGYVGVGTIEYLVLPPCHTSGGQTSDTSGGQTSDTSGGQTSDTSGGQTSASSCATDPTFYFLEMNTRLQVEHTVTEAIFGIDLVASQIDIARGLNLSTRPHPEPRGVALEVRLNAEDPDDGFAPRTGQILRYVAPDGPWVRVDSGYVEGGCVPGNFDSNVAKIITWGIHRQEALARMHSALDDTALVLESGLSNRALLRELIAESEFASGPVSTRWLDTFLKQRKPPHQRPHLPLALAAAAIGDHLSYRRQELRLFFAEALTGLPRRLPTPGPREFSYHAGDQPVTVSVGTLAPMTYLVECDAWQALVRARAIGNAQMQLSIDNVTHQVLRVVRTGHVFIEVNGVAHRLEKLSDGSIHAPIPAAVSQIHVTPGQHVHAGDRLVTLEAMKMEFPLASPLQGQVSEILITPSATVEAGQLLIKLQPAHNEALPAAAPLTLPPRERRPLSLSEVLRAQLLGYDIDGAQTTRALDTLCQHPERVSATELTEWIGLYLLGESLFWSGRDDDAAGPAGESSAEQLGRYLRRRDLLDEALSESFVQKLRQTLQAHGLTRPRELRAGKRLDHALMRILQARKDRPLRDRIATEALRALLASPRKHTPSHIRAGLSPHFTDGLDDRLMTLLEHLAQDATRRRRWELAALTWRLVHALEGDASGSTHLPTPDFWDDAPPALNSLPARVHATPTHPGVEHPGVEHPGVEHPVEHPGVEHPSGIALRSWHLSSTTIPDDQRIWVETCITPSEESVHDLRSLERATLEAATYLRQCRSDDASEARFNRIFLSIDAPLHTSSQAMQGLASRLAGKTGDLSLEFVALRSSGPLTLDGTPINAVIFAPATGLGPTFTGVSNIPPYLPLASPDLQVLNAHRRGLFTPAEVISWLTGGQTSAPNLAAIALSSPYQGTFQEWDLNADNILTPVNRPAGHHTANLVVGIISNRAQTTADHTDFQRLLIIGDATRTMGSLGEAECERIFQALEIAEQRNLPVEWVALSSGARIAMDSGTENLDATARVLRRIVELTQAGHPIHVIVDGPCVGAQSYWNAEATMLMHCKGALIMTPRGYMILTGRKALEFSGSVSAESNTALGGAPIMFPNGQAQYFAENLADAYRILFTHYRLSAPNRPIALEKTGRCSTPGRTNRPEIQGVPPQIQTSPETSSTALNAIFDPHLNPGKKKPFAIRALMRQVLDPGAPILERWAALQGGESAVTWLGELNECPITLIGIESQPVRRRGAPPVDGPDAWMSGTLFPQSSRKVARAINAASGTHPVVILANLSGFDGSPESLRERQLEWGAELARAVINFDGPILFNVIARYHGGAFVVFSQALNEGLQSTALEGTYASVIGGAPAAAVVFPRQVQRRAHALPEYTAIQQTACATRRRAALQHLYSRVQRELAEEFDRIHDVNRARQVGSLHHVISPDELRPHLIKNLPG
ncbi:hypothetical protein DL240_16680 [Lujinxingia litoralis]|uniref:biotin carboxylase n=1 Tax=Lujinxingia litoralis TaxID=2211119 RepID=A0A328C2D6_9DELT|nr:carboxyl transferase domain-containing protein [Lujinxingia litoralis]RAL20439.1 hypothetical protein DL240_16680 [Lujinxingia litoralis]